jgi:hypothetical protein
MTLHLLGRNEIDDELWDYCISRSTFPSLFAKSWYLDIFTDHQWQGIVEGDYLSVMPFYKKKKWLIPYISQPFLCQRGGVFSKVGHFSEFSFFYDLLKKQGYSINLLIRDKLPDQGKCFPKVNHILSLNDEYEKLNEGFNRNTIRNIRFASKSGLMIQEEKNPDIILNFLEKNDRSGYVKTYSKMILSLITKSFELENGFAIKAAISGNIVSLAYFIEDGGKLYFLLCASDPKGKLTKALYLIINEVIEKFAGRNVILDFAGSNMESIARRNLGFGASSEIYYNIKWNIFQF